MRISQIILIGVSAASLFGAAGAASAETPWQQHHPRQHEVLGRTWNQQRRITDARRDGDLTHHQAQVLRADDRRIDREDHRDARINGGFITKGQQRFLNRQENRVSHHI